MNEVQKIKRELSERLSSYYPRQESEQIARILLEEVIGTSYPNIVVGDYDLSRYSAQLEEWIRRLLDQEPLQYLIGHVEFMGLRLAVEPGVLIPRPETEELCSILIERGLVTSNKIVADIGTGSGAIALALASVGARVEAIEISPDALRVAQKNSESLGLEIDLRHADLFDTQFTPLYDQYSLVVSNPPYILDSESIDMRPHVLDHEPKGALFVPDSDPIRYYKRIDEVYGKIAERLAFEINPLAVSDLNDYFANREREFIEDISGRIRFLIVS